MGLSSAIATGIGASVGFGVISEYARYAILYAKWKYFMNNARDKVAEVLDALLEGEKDPLTGLSAKGQVDTIIEFIDKTIDFIGIVDEALATQMFIQMIQQSIAYAINASHAGSIGTLANVYSGGMYISGAESSGIGEKAENVDRYSRAFLGAETGLNIPSLTFNFIRGGERRLDDALRNLMTDISRLLDEWNDLALMYYRHYHSMARTRFENALELKESVTDRAYSLLEQVANEHLARINEMLDTVEGAKAWFDAGLLSENELIDICLRVDLERQASEADYNEYKTAILEAISNAETNWDTYVNTALNDLTVIETKYMMLIRSILDSLFNNVASIVEGLANRLNVTIEDVCAYRNVNKVIDVSRSVTELSAPLTGVNIVFVTYGDYEKYPLYLYKPDEGYRKILSDVDITALDWSPQRNLLRNPFNGELYLVYADYYNGFTHIFFRKSVDGGETWSERVRISVLPEMEEHDQYEVCAALDRNGNIHAVWHGFTDDSPYEAKIFYSRFDGESWSTPILLSTLAGMSEYHQYPPVVAVDKNNNVHVAWGGKTSESGGVERIWYRRFDGESWSPIIELSDDSRLESYNQCAPSITVDKNNNVHVVWSGRHVNGGYRIWHRMFNGSEWSEIVKVSVLPDGEEYYDYYPCVYADKNGFVHVVWYGTSPDYPENEQIWYSKFNGEEWSTPIRLSTHPEMESNPQYLPVITVYDNGLIVVAWYAYTDSYEFAVPAYTYYDGSWHTPVIIEIEEELSGVDVEHVTVIT